MIGAKAALRRAGGCVSRPPVSCLLALDSVDVGVYPPEWCDAVFVDQFHEIRRIGEEVFQILPFDSEGEAHDIGFSLPLLEHHAFLKILVEVEHLAITDLLQFLEALDRLILVRLIVRSEASDEFSVIEVGDFVIDAHLEGARIVLCQDREAVGKVKVALAELYSVAGFAVEAFQFFGTSRPGLSVFFSAVT